MKNWHRGTAVFLALLSITGALFLGCPAIQTQIEISPTITSPETSPPPSTPFSIPPAAKLQQAKVVRVVDGDTIEVDIGGKRYTVRYVGIDTPESVDPRRPVEYFGKEASAKNKELVEGKTVKLEKDVSETDRYGRLLRYVYVDSLFVNAELVRLGYAHAATFPPDVRNAEMFMQIEREARESRRGLWAAAATPTPSTRPATPTRTARPSATRTPTPSRSR